MCNTSLVFAQSSEVDNTQIFFDADQTSFDREGTKQVFDGNVIVIGGGIIISADRIELDRASNKIAAYGKIFLITQDQVFAGESLNYNMSNGDFKFTEAYLVVNNKEQTQALTHKILGFSEKEIEFEKERKNRLTEISRQKDELKNLFRSPKSSREINDEEIIGTYTKTLQREQLIREQLSNNLSRMPSNKRSSFKRRRDVWEQTKSYGNLSSSNYTYYFKLEGEKLVRVNRNDYHADDAMFTPCLCEEDESPAWAFRAPRINAQMGGYADLYHSVLEIKGIPVLYIPYLKIPLKDKRQSGFLLPSISYENNSGTIFSQPVYFAINNSSDATIATDWIEKRGIRLGAEYRKQFKKHSGFSLFFESLRDELWLDDLYRRRDLENTYSLGLSEARRKFLSSPQVPSAAPSSPSVDDYEWWNGASNITGYKNCLESGESEEACRAGISNDLRQPLNSWRGKFTWNGGVFLAPRLAIATEGEILSDHRYTEDLGIIGRDFEEILAAEYKYRSFLRSKVAAHLDGKNFYLGVGSSYGDNLRSDERFSGHQIPTYFKLQSRMFSLYDLGLNIPVYFQMSYNTYKISFKKNDLTQVVINNLQDSQWQRVQARLLVPLVSEQIFSLDYFTDVEQRLISYEEDSRKFEKIYSWKSGFHLELPLDGNMLIFPNGDDAQGTYLNHYMNWGLTLSTRPVVGRSGEYGNTFDVVNVNGLPSNSSKPLTYFSSDRREDTSLYDFAPDDESMFVHRKITFSTDHRWSFFERGWSMLPSKIDQGASLQSGQFEEQARRELLFSLDRNITDTENLFDDNSNWFINRYELKNSNFITPLSFNANISYDFYQKELLEEQRPISEAILLENENLEKLAADTLAQNPEDPTIQVKAASYLKQKKKVPALPEPWSLLQTQTVFAFANWRLVNNLDYHVSRKVATKINFSLGLPPFWDTNISLVYDESLTSVSDGGLDFIDTVVRTRSLNLATGLIPYVRTIVSLSKKVTDNQQLNLLETQAYQTKLGVIYQDPSDCWGIQFSREKSFDKEESEAEYRLALTVKFLGQSRPLPNMSAGLVRETSLESDSQKK